LDSEEGIYRGWTKPSKEVALGFDDLGKIASVGVKPGDRVTAGQVLMTQNDAVEQAQREAALAEADIVARIDLAEKRLEMNELRLEREIEGRKMGSSNQNQVDEATLERDIAATQIIEEKKQGSVAEARVRQAEVLIDQKKLISPIDGLVRAVEFKEGEIYSPQGGVGAVDLVTLDPLYVEGDIPASELESIQPGDEIGVRYGQDGSWQQAVVIFIDPVADMGVTTRTVRLELSNPDGKPAGLPVQMKLP
ncbi:MAG: efflux RND transporter periplasmic adaptor subunit, partial [Planctomycetota bacterium]